MKKKIPRQYRVTVKPNKIMPDLDCNGGWLTPQKDGNYVFHHCDKEHDGNYTAAGFAQIFIPKNTILNVHELAEGDVAL